MLFSRQQSHWRPWLLTRLTSKMELGRRHSRRWIPRCCVDVNLSWEPPHLGQAKWIGIGLLYYAVCLGRKIGTRRYLRNLRPLELSCWLLSPITRHTQGLTISMEKNTFLKKYGAGNDGRRPSLCSFHISTIGFLWRSNICCRNSSSNRFWTAWLKDSCCRQLACLLMWPHPLVASECLLLVRWRMSESWQWFSGTACIGELKSASDAISCNIALPQCSLCASVCWSQWVVVILWWRFAERSAVAKLCAWHTKGLC